MMEKGLGRKGGTHLCHPGVGEEKGLSGQSGRLPGKAVLERLDDFLTMSASRCKVGNIHRLTISGGSVMLIEPSRLSSRCGRTVTSW